jgi:endonuclease YncB( thermonuclease family)
LANNNANNNRQVHHSQQQQRPLFPDILAKQQNYNNRNNREFHKQNKNSGIFLSRREQHPNRTKKLSIVSKPLIVVKKMLSLCGLDVYFATQFNTVTDIPDNYFKEKREIKAIVVKVTDGDTYKVRHLASSQSRNYQGNLKDHTITVRIAAVDTPETAKQGNPGQKYANEAKEFAERKLLNQETTVKLLSKDQYGRVVGLIKYRERGMFSWFQNDRDISEELLKQGFASVYRQGGAQYDGSVERWNTLEKEAQKHKKGIWENGAEKADLPSTYKKNIKKKEASSPGPHDNRM